MTPALLAARMESLRVWVQRSNSSEQMDLAFTDQYSTPEVAHIVRDTADYGPRDIAHEYDRIILDLALVFGFNPSQLKAYYDPITTRWLDEDTIMANFNTDLQTEWNINTQKYDIDMSGFRNTDIYAFEPGTARVKLSYSIQDPAAIAAFAHGQASFSNDFICSYFILPTCANYAAATGYTSQADCVAYLDSLSANHVCPYAQRSNTAACRLTHAWAAGLLPSVHCPHTGKFSVPCKDTCLPACNGCHADAHCVATYPTLFEPVYECQCKPGFIGNGYTCAPQPCQYGQCPGLYGSYECSTGNCLCKSSFTHNPKNTGNDLCQCPDGGQIIYSNSQPVCVPVGKCISDRWECNKQQYSQVQCKSPSRPGLENTFTSFKACICNYGFQGGYEYPCSCPTGKRIVYSAAHDGDVCLTTTECTTAWHCAWPQHCSIPAGQTVGTCVA